MVYKFFDMNSLGSGTNSIPNQPLADEFHKPINKKLKRRKVYSSFKNIICISKNGSEIEPNKVWVGNGCEFYNSYFKK